MDNSQHKKQFSIDDLDVGRVLPELDEVEGIIEALAEALPRLTAKLAVARWRKLEQIEAFKEGFRFSPAILKVEDAGERRWVEVIVREGAPFVWEPGDVSFRFHHEPPTSAQHVFPLRFMDDGSGEIYIEGARINPDELDH